MSEPKITYMKTMAGATAVYLDRRRVGTIMQAEDGWIYVPAGLTLREVIDSADESDEDCFFDSIDSVKASLEEL